MCSWLSPQSKDQNNAMVLHTLRKQITLANCYMAVTFAYGGFRKSQHMKHATTIHYDRKRDQNIKVPVLTCDKLLVTTLCAFASVYAWPVFLYNDLKDLEISSNKCLDPTWYRYKATNTLLDYFY